MRSRPLALLFALILVALDATPGHAQYAVTDALTQALISQGNNNYLQQMATELGKLDTQINSLQSIQTQGQQLLTLVGNPSQALSFASGATGLNVSALANSSIFKSASSIASTVNGSRSLLNNGGGIFQAIPTTTLNGTTIARNTTAYNKFDAFEQEATNFQNTLQNAQAQRQTLLSQLQTVMGTAASSQAEQSEKIARISALSAQLNSNDQAIRDASEQRQAQNEANAQDAAKQKQATQEELNTEFNQAQSQADTQADTTLSGIVNQTP
jgi:hypothetical protein